MNVVWNWSQAAHGDLILLLPECDIEAIADSYYFMLDTEFLADEESILKTRLALGVLLGEWMRRVGILNKVGECCFLPFDFSDQYVGCIRVQMMEGDNVMCSYGCTEEYLGHSVNVTHLFDVKFDDDLFSVLSKSCLFGREEFMLQIERVFVGMLGCFR